MPHAVPILLTCLALLSPGCLGYPYRSELPSSHEATLDGIQRVAVESANGKVRISCRAGAAGLRVAAVRFARGSSEEDARAHAGAVRIELRQDPDEPEVYRVEAVVPRELSPYSAGAELSLELPPGTDLDVHTSNGAIEVEGARGTANLRTSNGRVEVAELEGDLEARTSNGRIVLREVAGRTLSAVTSNGDIDATGIAGEPSLKTSNGSIHLSLVRAPAHPSIKAHSSNGAIRLEVPPDVEADLSLRTSNGSVSRDLDAFEVTALEASRRRVSAVLNGGGGSIEAVTSNGAIRFGSSR